MFDIKSYPLRIQSLREEIEFRLFKIWFKFWFELKIACNTLSLTITFSQVHYSAFLAIPASFSDDDDVGIVMNDGRLSLKRSLLGPPRRRLAIKVYQRGLRQGHHLRPTTFFLLMLLPKMRWMKTALQMWDLQKSSGDSTLILSKIA